MEVALVLELARERTPNLAGAKFTHENLMDFSACMDRNPRLRMLFGRDEILFSALALGARGAVGSTYNFLAPLFRELIAAHERGDLDVAPAKQGLARRKIEVLIRHGGLSAMKHVLKWQGIDCGPWRASLHNLDLHEERALREEWDATRVDCSERGR
ncbi:MAG: hypothetical protein HC888_01245 [Candidatus Competibacteraceae bacterium]|nr:hypothetical protein [Candidatus Competibacteraceae bacterium]